MTHVQFELENGKIVNATLSDCGLFCHESCNGFDDKTKDQSGEITNPDCIHRYDCLIFRKRLNFHERKAQALPQCQIAAQKVKK